MVPHERGAGQSAGQQGEAIRPGQLPGPVAEPTLGGGTGESRARAKPQLPHGRLFGLASSVPCG